jgi:hypothetical protein
MSLSERIRRHLQSHVVGYLALFVALSGTALALPGKKQVKPDDLANGAVKGKAIAAGAVSTAKVRDDAITAPKLSPGAVTSAVLGGSAVGTAALADSSVTSAKLANDSVLREKIAQGEINGGKLANGAVNSSKVANATLLAEDFAPGQISDGFVLTASGPFTLPRAGRLYVTATFVADCPAAAPATCEDEYSVEIDGAVVPGTALSLDQDTGVDQLTLIGVSAPLAAGPHSIALANSVSTATETDLHLGGILLQ